MFYNIFCDFNIVKKPGISPRLKNNTTISTLLQFNSYDYINDYNKSQNVQRIKSPPLPLR
jgi:hypothetical protein